MKQDPTNILGRTDLHSANSILGMFFNPRFPDFRILWKPGNLGIWRNLESWEPGNLEIWDPRKSEETIRDLQTKMPSAQNNDKVLISREQKTPELHNGPCPVDGASFIRHCQMLMVVTWLP